MIEMVAKGSVETKGIEEAIVVTLNQYKNGLYVKNVNFKREKIDKKKTNFRELVLESIIRVLIFPNRKIC